MLKLPKGLKKKKKGKKSKKDKELFTEEELEQYRREHQKQPEVVVVESEEASASANAATAADQVHHHQQQQHYHQQQYEPSEATTSGAAAAALTAGEDDEWRRFNALATGVDSILKKSQGDLDRIKSTSFFKRVAPASEVKKAEDEHRLQQEKEERAREEAAERERKAAAEEKANDHLANAVIELSDSESDESADGDDIFDTTYIDVVKDLPLAYVPESPDEPVDDGPDPFDTSYADKVIKGPEVSKKGKKLVNIGSAVEVLTGRVESTVKKPTARRPRRGPRDLLVVQSFDEDNVEDLLEKIDEPINTKTLLDSPADLPDAPIDLSVSLHLTLAKEVKKSENTEEASPSVNVDEFDEIRNKAAQEEEDQLAAFLGGQPTKPSRPAPPKAQPVSHLKDFEELDLPNEDDVDPFDTKFVEQLLPASLNEDPDFDPRAFTGDEETTPTKPQEELFSPDFPTEKHLVPHRDLLGGSTSDLTQLPAVGIAPTEREAEVEIDPFDTSAVSRIVAPGKTELKFLEKELLEKHAPPPRPPPLPASIVSKLKPSLSDPDFDPRASEPEKSVELSLDSSAQAVSERKSSLSLHIPGSHRVSFTVPSPDLLGVGGESGKIQKPLTPYYSKAPPVLEEGAAAICDPFDTSFVAEIKPTQVELTYLEQDLLAASDTKDNLSDDDFNPRAITPQPVSGQQSDWLNVSENNPDTKVLTPAIESGSIDFSYLSDPFDTSTIASNILPGQAELKLIENELLPEIHKKAEPISDILSFSQDDSLPVKALTPQVSGAAEDSAADIDPFDTSFASNLAPGQAEIKLLESELIEN